MKNLAKGLVVVCATIASPAAAQEDAAAFFDNYVRPHLSAYATCAKQHIAQVAQREATSSFERIEGTLRPACGMHVDRARDALSRAGLDKNQANAIIRTAYTALQPELRSIYDQTASYERQRRQAEKEEIARQQRAREAEIVQQQQARDAEKERDNLLKEAASQHNNCLLTQMKEIVPFSNESAETLAQVVITKCAEARKNTSVLAWRSMADQKRNFKK